MADDGNGGISPEATVTLTIFAPNNPPVANDDTVSGAEDGGPISGTATATDPENQSLSFSKGTDPSNGSVTVSTNGQYSYTPDPDFNGQDSFDILVDDGNGGTDTATITVDVTPVNDAPVADDATTTGAINTVITGTVTGTDVDLDTLLFSKSSDPANGIVVVNGDGSYTYTPNLDFTGFDNFSFLVDDQNGGTDVGTVSITVGATSGPQPGDYDNQFYGDATDNPIQGTALNDWIEGGDGRDNINGLEGDDYIDAGAGNDWFVQGGTGADIFRFASGYDDVKIFDFEDGVDLIHLTDGLTFADLTQTSSVAGNGLVTVFFTTPTGDRLMLRDEDPTQIDANDFFV